MENTALISEKCLYHNGALAHQGRLTLYSDRLVFEPTGRLDKMLGVKAHLLRISSLTDVDFRGVNRTLVLQVGEHSYKYTEDGARNVYKRLTALIKEQKTGETSAFESGERVLATGQVQMLIGSLVGASGEITLTDRNFQFQPSKLDTLVLEVKPIDVPLTEVKKVSLAGIRRNLHVTISGKVYVFSGTSVAALFGVLQAKGINSEDAGSKKVLGRWDAQLFAGPLASPGTFIVGNDTILFEPKGRLDAALGVEQVRTKIANLDMLECTGWPERRFVIHTGGREFVMALANSAARYLDLLPLLLRARTTADPAPDISGRLSPEDCAKLIQAWGYRMNDAEEIVGGSPALHLPDDWAAIRGHLVMTSRNLIFGGAGGSRAQQFRMLVPMIEAQPHEQMHDHPDRLLFSHNDKKIDFQPLSGHELVTQFWSYAEKAVHNDAFEQTFGWQFRQLLGEVAFIETYLDDEMVWQIGRSNIINHVDGMAILATDPVPASIEPGMRLALRAGADAGIYTMTCTVVGADKVTSEDGMETWVLVCRRAPDLAVSNRRSSYRVQAKMAISAQKLARTATRGWVLSHRAQPIRCMLENLSIGGCAMTSKEALDVGARLQVHLPPKRSEIRVMAEVLETVKTEGGYFPYRHRCKFIGMTAQVASQLNTQVMKYQRSQIARQKND